MSKPSPKQEELDGILRILYIQRGGLPGIVESAPAQKSYYMACEHTDPETEVDSQHLTNYDKEVKEAKLAIESYVRERERLARIDEIQKLSDDTADLLPNETWKSWAFRVSDYLKDRIKALQTTSEAE